MVPRASVSLLVLITLIELAAPAGAQSVLEVLEANYRIENRLFDAELGRYDHSRRAEKDAHQTLLDRSDALDRMLRNRGTQLDQLNRMEVEVNEAREVAYAASRDLATQRQQIYRRLARMAELDAEIRRERGRQLIPSSLLDGFWEIEFQPTGEVGLLKLRVEGTLVVGTYRLSGDRLGSLRGTLAGNRVDLERIDNTSGFDSVLEGEFNPALREIKGGWTAIDLSGGSFGGGTWRARKLSLAEEENLQLDSNP